MMGKFYKLLPALMAAAVISAGYQAAVLADEEIDTNIENAGVMKIIRLILKILPILISVTLR